MESEGRERGGERRGECGGSKTGEDAVWRENRTDLVRKESNESTVLGRRRRRRETEGKEGGREGEREGSREIWLYYKLERYVKERWEAERREREEGDIG